MTSGELAFAALIMEPWPGARGTVRGTFAGHAERDEAGQDSGDATQMCTDWRRRLKMSAVESS